MAVLEAHPTATGALPKGLRALGQADLDAEIDALALRPERPDPFLRHPQPFLPNLCRSCPRDWPQVAPRLSAATGKEGRSYIERDQAEERLNGVTRR